MNINKPIPLKHFQRISFCTGCMGRLHHLKRTLRQNIRDNCDYPNVEYIIVNYNSPDGLHEWIHEEMSDHIDSGLIRYWRTEAPQVYHFSKVKNLSHGLATGDILCALDADNFTGKGFATYINEVTLCEPKTVGFSKGATRMRLRGTEGRLFIHQKYFNMLDGYDENYRGWSYEDYDLLERAKNMGLRALAIPAEFLHCIGHGKRERRRRLDMSLKMSVRRNSKLIQATKINSYREMLLDEGCCKDDIDSWMDI